MRTCQGVGCGASLEGKRSHAKWCSDACRERTKRHNRGLKSIVGRPRATTLYEATEDGHWRWLLGHFTDGYGCINRDGRARQAHIWLYEQLVGPVPEGCELHHVCLQKWCVNVLDPEHVTPIPYDEHRRLHAELRRGNR